MVKVNPHYAKIDRPYIFGLIDEKRAAFPFDDTLNLGVGDICHPLDPVIVKACQDAIAEMGDTPHGYGPPQGHLFLREAICKSEYAKFGLSADEVFVSEGTKNDVAGLQELFSEDCRVGITDPTYPTYVDTNILQGRKVTYIPCTEENAFIPTPPDFALDLIYLCSPNNPTGTCLTYDDLQKWVRYAKEHTAILLFDAAYVDFARAHMPKSIYEIPGAKEVAIEMRTFSKSHGFTGLRCGYTVVPFETTLNAMWMTRQNNKTNGVSYPVQRAAFAALSVEKKSVAHYSAQAAILAKGLQEQGHTVYGGLDAPYIWWKAPNGLTSWEYFDILLENAHCIAIPGSAFGPCGEGFVRLSAFLEENVAQKALARFRSTLSSVCACPVYK